MPREISPYGHYATPRGETASSMVGERVARTTFEAVHGQLSRYSTAPYVPPKTTAFGCLGKEGKCQAYPVRGTEYCIFHTPKDDGEPPEPA